MKKLTILFLSILLVGICTTSCGSKGSSGCSDVETEQKESELSTAQGILLDAQIAYATDVSQANCTSLTDAWDDYIKKLRSFIDCMEGPARDPWETNYSLQVQERNNFSC